MGGPGRGLRLEPARFGLGGIVALAEPGHLIGRERTADATLTTG